LLRLDEESAALNKTFDLRWPMFERPAAMKSAGMVPGCSVDR
jgi:hypothetical protein